ncbi:MAG: hypothetical protein JNK16_11600 [Phycisphaerales bacterium]|nr:hypothetical protein [Phycisphaerales bacterium]
MAVQVSYADWLEIERILRQRQNGVAQPDLSQLQGKLQLSQDPLAYQDQARGEWR